MGCSCCYAADLAVVLNVMVWGAAVVMLQILLVGIGATHTCL